MSNKLLRAIVASAGDEQQQRLNDGENKVSKKSESNRHRKSKSSKNDQDTTTNVDPVQAHLQQLLQFDRAIERYSSSGQRVLKRKTKEVDVKNKQRKNVKQATADGGVGTGSARSSSAPRLEQEPTFNKRRYRKEKEEQSIRDLAKMLRKSKKAKKKKRMAGNFSS